MTDHNTASQEISETEEQAQNPGIKEAVELYDKKDSSLGSMKYWRFASGPS